ncbi:Bifunctional polymyxin resistance [Musa troglodytarum]|uniref:Bifunctional polymyxin resistance n=1 Tax=Musa troglodytarum TaxID=320322 RepID=A0A9E7G9I8_9LILI|nr:Bifunctional polymyxin resistance [Musa troglodytarum]
MPETDGGDPPQRQDQAPPRSTARGVAGGEHHPWDFLIRFHSLIIKLVMYCLDSDKRLIRFITCEVYGTKTGSLLSKDHPLRKVPVSLLRLKRLGAAEKNDLMVGIGTGTRLGWFWFQFRTGACDGRASLKEFCGEGYVDSDKEIANVVVIIKELGWNAQDIPGGHSGIDTDLLAATKTATAAPVGFDWCVGPQKPLCSLFR